MSLNRRGFLGMGGGGGESRRGDGSVGGVRRPGQGGLREDGRGQDGRDSAHPD
jgi:hypothetical protein